MRRCNFPTPVRQRSCAHADLNSDKDLAVWMPRLWPCLTTLAAAHAGRDLGIDLQIRANYARLATCFRGTHLPAGAAGTRAQRHGIVPGQCAVANVTDSAMALMSSNASDSFSIHLFLVPIARADSGALVQI